MSYVDGFVIPVKKSKLKFYWPMARMGKKMWLKAGALDYKECVGDDLKAAWGLSFRKLAKAKADETVIFSYIVYKNRAHRDKVNAKVMKSMTGEPPEMPFSMKRMAYGGFKTIVE